MSTTAHRSEVEARADFSHIRYAQVWEDADILLDGLEIQPGDICVSIASAGDNALAMLTRDPAKVIALDLNPAQLCCLELRVAAYKTLTHEELLILLGSRAPSAGDDEQRRELYQKCRPLLSDDCRRFWDAYPTEVAAGIGSAGKFERYFALFRERVLPWIHSRSRVVRLLQGAPTEAERTTFYEREWNNVRWKLLFRVFFSRAAMGKLGRDPAFFRYVEGSVADRILSRTRHALTHLNPAENPYLHWILTGHHGAALPCALRPENFEKIRAHIDRLEWRCQPLEAFVAEEGAARRVDHFNLSDIFEYMSPESYEALLRQLVSVAKPGGRFAYWNMLAPRSRPEAMANLLRPLTEEANRLHRQDKAFFYSAFVLEEVLPE
ncbi:MAG: hypothetical protein OHK0029_05350 [Armatimonadaceae bacterium]